MFGNSIFFFFNWFMLSLIVSSEMLRIIKAIQAMVRGKIYSIFCCNQKLLMNSITLLRLQKEKISELINSFVIEMLPRFKPNTDEFKSLGKYQKRIHKA